MAVPVGEPVREPLQMPDDLAGHLLRPYAPHRQVEVPLRPDGEAVVGADEGAWKIEYLS
jgi:hypothetical protein